MLIASFLIFFSSCSLVTVQSYLAYFPVNTGSASITGRMSQPTGAPDLDTGGFVYMLHGGEPTHTQ
jgi:hypothetical protein